MTTAEIVLSILFPLALGAWGAALLSAHVWRKLSEYWRQECMKEIATNARLNARLNVRRDHPLGECIRRASLNRNRRIP